MIDSLAKIETSRVGTRVSVGPFTQIRERAAVGDGCNVGSHCLIDDDVTLNSNVSIGHGVVLCSGTRVEANVNIGPGTIVGRMSVSGEQIAPTMIGSDVVIDANCTISRGIRIEARAWIKAGSLVSQSVPASAIVEGNPASIVGYVDAARFEDSATPQWRRKQERGIEETAVAGVTIHTFPVVEDLRGNLTVGEFELEVPFIPRRYFMVYDVPSKEIRGEHAHKVCHQFLICVRGSCTAIADDGIRKVEVDLDQPNVGLYLPPMTWGIQYKYSPEAILLVYASHHYDAGDYIRDYQDFLKFRSGLPLS